jgi:hypothetical protein
MLLRKKAQKRQAGADAFYRVINAIREKYLSENQATDLGEFITARLDGCSEPTEDDAKFRGVLRRQPAHHCHGDGDCDHHADDPFAIIDSIINRQIGCGCENCSHEHEEVKEITQEANLAIGQFKVAAKRGMITLDQFFNVLQWLRTSYDYKPARRKGDAIAESKAIVYDLDEYRRTHPKKKETGPKTFGPDSSLFSRLLAAIQSGSFRPSQAKELTEKLLEKFSMKFFGLPVADRETMRSHAARRRLKRIGAGEVALLIALAEHKLNCQQAQCAIRWLHALYEEI